LVLESNTLDRKNFNKQAEHKWCYLYFETQKLNSFLDDTNTIRWMKQNLLKEREIPPSRVYFVEIDLIKKDRLNFLIELHKKYHNAHIYIFAQKALLQSELCRYAIHVKAKNISGFPVDSKSFNVLINKALQESIQDFKSKKLLEVMQLLEENLALVYYKDKFQWQSAKARDFYELNESNFPIESFDKEKVISLKDNNDKEHTLFAFSVKEKNRSALLFLPIKEACEESLNTQLKHRFETIEWFKDQLVYNHESGEIKVVLMHLINNKIMLKSKGYLAHHEWVKELLSLIQKSLSRYEMFSQWSEDYFLLCFNESENVKEKITHFFEQLNMYDTNSVPIFEVSTFGLNNISLVDIIDILDALCEDKISLEQMQQINLVQLHSEHDSLSESEKIFRLLYAAMISKTPIKLQNIYKGLCINTSSKAIGHKDGMLYFECQLIQGYAANESKSVTILGDMFNKDIHANVKMIDLDKRFLIADEFYYMNTSANNRKYTRVQTKVRTPVTVRQNRVGIHGEILDISLKSLALTSRQPLNIFKQNSNVELEFRLPDSTNENGYCTIRGLGEITYVSNTTSKENKLVIMLKLRSPYDAHLLRYMYMRQKELICELKALSRLR
jgi:hypothetical protein